MSLKTVVSHLYERTFDETREPYATVREYSRLPISRLYAIRRLAAEVFEEEVEGDIVEVGPCEAGVVALLGHTSRTRGGERKIWLFDTPARGGAGAARSPSQNHARTLEEVDSIDRCRQVLGKLGVPERDFTFVPESFDQNLWEPKDQRISVLRLDTEGYETTLRGLLRFYDLVNPGGLVLIDQFTEQGETRRAVEAFFNQRRQSVELVRIDASACFHHKQESTEKMMAACYY